MRVEVMQGQGWGAVSGRVLDTYRVPGGVHAAHRQGDA
jgi:hypothetical protein